MIGDGSFLVEDFINAITAQLDRVQDALRLKAVNRPLTYALKDLSLDLQIFVELDPQGGVRFRTSGPNETGASTVRLSFTTITKPMIEENTISLAMTRSPLLEEIGLDEEERKRLEQIGVRNAAQLQRLGDSTGARSVSRLSGIPMERLREALGNSRPRVTQVKPEKPPVISPQPPPAAPPSSRPPRVKTGPAIEGRPEMHTGPAPPRVFNPVPAPPVLSPRQPVAPVTKDVIQVAPNTRRLQLFGDNLIGEKGSPKVFLNKQALDLAEAEDDRLIIELPGELSSGALEIEMPDGGQFTYELSVIQAADGPGDEPGAGADPWAPQY